MYLMTYLFDFPKDHGKFAGDSGYPGKIKGSKNWHKLDITGTVSEPVPPLLSTFDTEGAKWKGHGDMDTGSIVIPNKPAKASVGIRFAINQSVLSGPFPAGATLECVICFGKPTQAAQAKSSPFLNRDQSAKTTFHFPETLPNKVDPNGDPVWFFPLGFIELFADSANGEDRCNRHEFAVGIIVRSPAGIERHYSHDPEMDIGA